MGIGCEQLRVAATRSELGGLRLQARPHFVERIDVAVRDVGDDQALTAPVVEQPLRDETTESLAHRGAGHPEAFGLLDLEQRATRTECAVENLGSQLAVGTGRGAWGL